MSLVVAVSGDVCLVVAVCVSGGCCVSSDVCLVVAVCLWLLCAPWLPFEPQ